MPKTLGTLLTNVRSRLDETTARFWTDAEVRRWIVEAARDVARRAETLLTTQDVTIVAATQEYALATDTLRVYRAEWEPGGTSLRYPLEYRDFNSMDAVWGISKQVTQGYPYWFTLWGFPPNLKITFYPKPSVAGKVVVFYYKLPADLATDGTADSSNVDVPEGWWDALELYCEFVALRKDGDPRWLEAKQLYEEKVAELVEVSRRWSDQADAIQYRTALLPAWLYGSEDVI